MKAGIVKPIDGGMIRAVASPAQVHRALLCASLCDKETYIECNEMPDDIMATVGSLNGQGAKIRYDGSGFEVIPVEIPTSRIKVKTNSMVRNSKLYRLPGDVAYQSITGLLLTLPISNEDSAIEVEGIEEYRSYIDMTIDTLEMFGVKIERKASDDGGAVYKIAGGQKYISPGVVKPEGDWTSASVWLCAAAIYGSGVICTNLNRYSRQGDKEIVNILERFGAITSYRGDSVAVRRARLRSIRIDAAETPELVPMLAVVAAAAEGQTVIYNAERVRLNESGILNKVSTILNALGAGVIENRDGLIIRGKPSLEGGLVSSLGDHRIAMMTAIASGVCEDAVAITDAEAVSSSYPDFFDDFEKLGGKVTRGMESRGKERRTRTLY